MQDEGSYIAAYKDYARKHLPRTATLGGLWAPDFDITAYASVPDELGAIELYLSELVPYAKVLTRAARLRQLHYDKFVTDEDPGHQAWRTGMNVIAEDARDKVGYWTQVRDKMLARAIEAYEALPKPRLTDAKKYAGVRNVDNDDDNVPETKTEVVSRPRLSKAERARRRRLRKKDNITAIDNILSKRKRDVNQILMHFKAKCKTVRLTPHELLQIVKCANDERRGLIMEICNNYLLIEMCPNNRAVFASNVTHLMTIGVEMVKLMSSETSDKKFYSERLFSLFWLIRRARQQAIYTPILYSICEYMHGVDICCYDEVVGFLIGVVPFRELEKFCKTHKMPTSAKLLLKKYIATHKGCWYHWAIITLKIEKRVVSNIVGKKQQRAYIDLGGDLFDALSGYPSKDAPNRIFGWHVNRSVPKCLLDDYAEARQYFDAILKDRS